MNNNHRQEYHRAWSRLTPPLRPHPEVVAAVRNQIVGRRGRTLLLGVTPELADVAPDLIAVDRNLSMVKNIWPGNTSARRVIVGDWRNLTFAPRSFASCIGDGSLCGLRHPDEMKAVLAQVAGSLEDSGRFVCRLYVPPASPETVSAIKDAVLSGGIQNFHAFKFRLGMALSAQAAASSIGVAAILIEFNRLFGDRSELVRSTGWDRQEVDTIDFYEASNVHFYFPGEDQVLSVASKIFRSVRLIPAGTYEMASLCPLLVAETS